MTGTDGDRVSLAAACNQRGTSVCMDSEVCVSAKTLYTLCAAVCDNC
jgi:hypothetical protein